MDNVNDNQKQRKSQHEVQVDSEWKEEDHSIVGGLIRNILRNLKYVLRAETIGSMPRRIKVPTRYVIAQSADKLSQIHDIRHHVKHAHEKHKNSQIKTNPFKLIFNTISTASLGIIKSALLGGALFTIHDEIYKLGMHAVNNNIQNSSSTEYSPWFKYVIIPGTFSCIAGTISGAGHGILSSLWDKTSYKLHPNITLSTPSHIIGTSISHACVHCILFGLYESIKRLHLYMFDLHIIHDNNKITADIPHVLSLYSICISSIIAGCSAEFIGLVTEPLESQGFKLGHKESLEILRQYSIRDLTEVSYKTYLRFSVPSMLGFLVYEFATS
jgi:hypothetical protein